MNTCTFVAGHDGALALNDRLQKNKKRLACQTDETCSYVYECIS